MSIKGKPKTIPPYYKTAGKFSFEFGEEVRNPHRYTAAPAPRQVALSFDQALERIDDRGLIMTPYSRFIPLPYLSYNNMTTGPTVPESNLRTEFLNNLARRALNNLIAQRGITDPVKQQEIQQHQQWLVRKLRTKERTGPFVDVLQSVWAEGKLSGTRQVSGWMKNWCGFDWPIDMVGQYTNTSIGSVYSREAMFQAFTHTEGSVIASQRTYEARIQYLTLVYRTVPVPPRKAHPYIPLVLPVVTLEQLMYQKIHMMLHGTIDLQQVNFLVDREIDSPNFAVSGLREFYKKLVEPHLLSLSANVWKVPVDFIQSHCFLPQGAPQARNIFEYEEACSNLIDGLYKTISGTSRPAIPPKVVLVEKDVELEATLLAADSIAVEEDAPRPLAAEGPSTLEQLVERLGPRRQSADERPADRRPLMQLDESSPLLDSYGREVHPSDYVHGPVSGLQRMEQRAQEQMQADGNVLPRPATAAEEAMGVPTYRRPGDARRPARRTPAGTRTETAEEREIRLHRERQQLRDRLRGNSLSSEEQAEVMGEATDIVLPDHSDEDWFRMAEGLAENPE